MPFLCATIEIYVLLLQPHLHVIVRLLHRLPPKFLSGVPISVALRSL